MTQRLDIDALRALCAIEDFGGITRASETISLSQSAVSHKIKRLERNLDCELLTRRSGAPRFTQDGKRLLAYARRILSMHDEALLSLSKQPLSGKIRLGMTEDITSSGLSRILGRFTRLHPNATVRTHVKQSLQLDTELKRNEIDLGVMQIFKHSLLSSDIILFEDKLHWVKALDHQKPFPFLSYDDKCFYKNWAMDAGQIPNLGLETVLECASTSGIVSAVQAGLGITLLPERYISSEMQIIDDQFPNAPDLAYIVRIGKKSHSAPVKALAKEVADNSSQYVHLQAV